MGGFYVVRRRDEGGGLKSLLVPPRRGTRSPFLIVPGYELLDPRELEDLIEAFAKKRSEREREGRSWRLPTTDEGEGND